MNRPYIFCHMLTSLDGKIMGNYMSTPEGEIGSSVFYDLAFGKDRYYKHQGWLSGRVTTDAVSYTHLILMFFILFCIATAVLSGISIKKATSIARQNSSKETANTFEIQNNLATNFTGTMPESLVNKVSKVNGIKNYDASVQGIGLVFKQLQNVEPKNNTVQYTDTVSYTHL